jgi:hypothetical protein
MSAALVWPVVRRHAFLSPSTTLAAHAHTIRPRYIRKFSEKLDGRDTLRESERDAASKRDSSQPQPRSSDAPEESTNDGPPDQRPMLVRIIMSVFRSFWQSIGRVWEVLPGTKSLRIVFFLFVLAVYNVRSAFLKHSHRYVTKRIPQLNFNRCAVTRRLRNLPGALAAACISPQRLPPISQWE